MAGGWIDVTPGQPTAFTFEQGAGILVASCDPTQSGCPNNNQFTNINSALIDGLTFTGANESGGGIYLNGYAPYTQITNNEIFGNQGGLAGGIRLGTLNLTNAANTGSESSHNENVTIKYNHIAQNGSLTDGGGGISIFTGSDNYRVMNNMLCGNFSANYGGGIDHFGLSPGGLIVDNLIFSNESFDEGGGIMIAGELVPAGAPAGTLTQGSGSVTINANRIQGNKAGDDGGGIRTLMVNGEDVRLNPGDPTKWHQINIFNNIIVNNSSADFGGGLSFDDTVKVNVIGNMITHNDSTATGSDAFGGPCVVNNPPGQICPAEAEGVGGLISSIPRVGGIATYAFSTGLQAVSPGSAGTFSNPALQNNIIWQNRSFYWDATYCNNFGGLRPDVRGLCSGPNGAPGTPEDPYYWDLAVVNTPTIQLMSPTYSILTNGVGANPDATNLLGTDSVNPANPAFVSPYVNVYEATAKGAAFGNFVTTTFTPNGLIGDYHIGATSSAIDKGSSAPLSTFQELLLDYYGHSRPFVLGGIVDIGAEEVQ